MHTHYDGQVTWDPLLNPVVVARRDHSRHGQLWCGFRPRQAGAARLAHRTHGRCRGHPGSVLAEGMTWNWESFPDYLDAIDTPHAIDFAAQLPHGALRTYVMGRRGGDHFARPTADEMDRMRDLVAEAVESGALGWSTSRSAVHKTSAGEPTPSLTASREELTGMAAGLAKAGAGVIDFISDFMDQPEEMEFVSAIVEAAQRPMSVSVVQSDRAPDKWRDLLDGLAEISAAQGIPITVKWRRVPWE
ncbi:amidohydrolase family protein [Rhodococcus hoagii]|nr:amidohydrolase family protein [Prescottella equi]